jgi:hypothetical protein
MQMIRGQGRDTNNYVLFDPDKVRIDKINDEEIKTLLD